MPLMSSPNSRARRRRIDQRHRHGLALGLAEDEAIAAVNCGGTVALPLNWLTIWHSVTLMRPSDTAKAEFGDVELDLDLADADLADEGMVAGIAALRRIAEAEVEAFVAAGQGLEPQVAIERELQRFARQVADRSFS